MIHPVPKEESQSMGVAARPCVKNGDPAVFDYLSKVFGRHNLYCCRPGDKCQFVCPKELFPFEVFESLEVPTTPNGLLRAIINPGIYRITHNKDSENSHFLILEKYINEKWETCVGFYGGWVNGMMVDLCGIRPVKI